MLRRKRSFTGLKTELLLGFLLLKLLKQLLLLLLVVLAVVLAVVLGNRVLNWGLGVALINICTLRQKRLFARGYLTHAGIALVVERCLHETEFITSRPLTVVTVVVTVAVTVAAVVVIVVAVSTEV